MWQRPRHRGARRRGGGLTDPAGAIRPAVEAALAVARDGLAADPVVPPPQALRPYLGFSRLSPGALRAIAGVVERDAAFRARVAAAVDEERVGRAGWLWLTRPEGWAEELAAIEAEVAARAEEERRARDERSAVKKLAAVQAAAEEAAAEAERRAREVEELRAEVARLEAVQAEVTARLVEAEAQADRLAAARTEAVRNLKQVEARLVERSTELNAAKARIRELEEQLRARTASGGRDRTAGDETRDRNGARPGAGPVRRPDVEPVAPGGAGGAGSAGQAGRAAPDSGPGDSGPGGAAPGTTSATAGSGRAAPAAGATGEPAAPGDPAGPGRDVLAQELARAAAGASSLADSLASLAHLLTAVGADPGAGAPPAGADPGAPARPPAVAAEAGSSGGGTRATGRVPVRLPGGIFDDSAAAAEHLLRTPGAVLVVDGYNVSMTAWPALTAAEQRRRLVGVLAEAAARTATETEIVFDGADVDNVPVPAPVRSLVHVRFSPPGVEADDVVLDLVASLPASRPVVVASSDNRVRAGARALGANVVHARQLLDALRR